jgi:hypothetical protein
MPRSATSGPREISQKWRKYAGIRLADCPRFDDGGAMLEKRGSSRKRPIIEVLSGTLVGKKISLGLTMVTVGKDEGMDLAISDDSAAEAHAGFLFWKGEARVFDFGTEAGTFVNGERVAETALADNDEIQIGATRFRFIGNA